MLLGGSGRGRSAGRLLLFLQPPLLAIASPVSLWPSSLRVCIEVWRLTGRHAEGSRALDNYTRQSRKLGVCFFKTSKEESSFSVARRVWLWLFIACKGARMCLLLGRGKISAVRKVVRS